ncbi:MAG: CusA/CzcA family heavy metal efflux RND transporter [Betaproteobacteria bacterium]|nr:CusA/CzcA family heavy metal efflux RND transporter [Betaproteobacteria bacterium]
MIAAIIRWSIRNRVLVLLATVLFALWGSWSALTLPVDALPDLSDVQVILRTSDPGQPPQVVEDQVTWPLATTMLSVPEAKTVRGYSSFGDSFLYVLFRDGTDPYWARSRVLEYLDQAQSYLPAGIHPALGPDATGVDWVYEYALVDRSGRHDLGQLRSLQDWFLRFELKSVPGVAEVATLGGMVRQYQVVLDPERLAAYRIPQSRVIAAIREANQETGGSVIELAEAEYMVRARGYLKTVDDFRRVPLGTGANGVPVLLGDVADVRIGPQARRGIAELDGQGEVVGGVVILRSGANARATIAAVKARLAALAHGLPPGVQVVPVYDRSALIDRSIGTLRHKLIEELVVVALVCGLFLWHLRSAMVAIVSLPLGILFAFSMMRIQGINANIMSLGGIAIAIGAMVDAAVVMIENAHKKIEQWHEQHPDRVLQGEERWRVIGEAAQEVGPALFFSLLVITLSFVPIFSLQAQEGRLFAPLAYTKTWAMAGAAGLSVTLVPVLMGYWIRGRIPAEYGNPINRWLVAVYRPLLDAALAHPRSVLLLAVLLVLVTAWPLSRIGSEFMPPLDEGDLLYMPSALPGLSAAKAAELLQQTDRLIKTVPEVAHVFGKAGRADTATDPAPMEMFETTIEFKPRSQWRPGMTPAALVQTLDRVVRVPGLANVWVPPIRNRIDMQATGIKSPVGVRVSGSDPVEMDRIARQVAQVAATVPGVRSAFADRLTGGRYIDVNIDRQQAARYGLSLADVQSTVTYGIGGADVGEVIDGRARYPVSVRYPRWWRDSTAALRTLPVVTPAGVSVPLGAMANIAYAAGPSMLKSENARPSTWVYIDVQGRPLTEVVTSLQRAVRAQVRLAPGISLEWTGQYAYLQHAEARLRLVVPVTLLIILLLLYGVFGNLTEALLILSTLPFALVGGVWFLYWLGYDFSVAVAVGFIALAGVSSEFGVIMLLYLDRALAERREQGLSLDAAGLLAAVRAGAVQRVRPKAMTAAVILAGLLPVLLGGGTGSEVMSRIAAPMVGGMLTAPLMSMFVIPLAWYLLRRGRGGSPDRNGS